MVQAGHQLSGTKCWKFKQRVGTSKNQSLENSKNSFRVSVSAYRWGPQCLISGGSIRFSLPAKALVDEMQRAKSSPNANVPKGP